MFKEIDMSNCMNQSNKPSKDKNLVISFSLLMRLFEWCHEEAKDDVDMHKMMEKLISFNDGVNPLTIDVYDCLLKDIQPEDVASDEDLENAYNMGETISAMNIDLSNVRYSDAGEIIMTAKDNGYGASNNELEQFWQGYGEKEPVQQGCWSEMDISNIVDREQPTTITIGGEDEQPCCASGDMLDTDMLTQIEEIIKTGRL